MWRQRHREQRPAACGGSTVRGVGTEARAEARQRARRGSHGGALAWGGQTLTFGRACSRRPACKRASLSAQRLPRGRKIAAERWERLDGEDRAGNKRGEAAKEVCNRTSDARCAGVPNLGSIGREMKDFLPQLCGGSRGQALIGSRKSEKEVSTSEANVSRLHERAWFVPDEVEDGMRFAEADRLQPRQLRLGTAAAGAAARPAGG